MKKTIEIIVIVLFAGVVIVLVLVNLPKSGLFFNPEKASKKIRGAWEMLQYNRVLAENAKVVLEWQKSVDARDALTTVQKNKILRSYMISGGLAVGIVVFFGGLAGIVGKVIFSRGEEIAAVLLAMRRNSPPDVTKEMLRLEIERFRFEREQLKIFDRKALPENVIDMEEVQPGRFLPLDAKQALDKGLMTKGTPHFFLGMNLDTGDPEEEDIASSRANMRVIGLQGLGKSNTMQNIAAQSLLKGWVNIWIDLHAGNEKSFTARMGSLIDSDNVFACATREQVKETLVIIEKLIDDRLSGSDGPPCLIVIDEVLSLASLFPEVADTCQRVSTEGGKCQIFMIAAAHTWKGNDLKTTTVRDNLPFAIAHRTEKKQARTFFDDAKLAKECQKLERGQTIQRDMSGDVTRVGIPLWTFDAIQHVQANMIVNPFPDFGEITEEELEKYDNVVRLRSEISDDDLLGKVWDIVAEKKMTKKAIATNAGITPQTLNQLLNGNRPGKLQMRTKTGLRQAIGA